jgi:hypothetical protein
MNQLEIAKKYAKNGIEVFPCNQDKAPITKNGHKNATRDIRQIEAWWTKHPNALIGAPNQTFTIIDVDCYGLCATGQLLTDNAIKLLHEEGIFRDGVMKVNTGSGGIHYYYKKKEVKRSTKVLPNIDLLSNGGYSILPDQKTYVCETSNEPWEQIKHLEDLDMVKLSILIDENEEFTKAATLLKKASKGMVSYSRQSTKENTAPSFTETEKMETFGDGYRTFNDYKGNQVKFAFENNVYEKNERVYKFNPNAKLLNENRKFVLRRGETTQEMLMSLFFNIEIQKIVGEYLGLNVPHINHSTRQRSILPNHNDRRPSMSVRWVDGNHLVARDHSNHFSDKYNQIDYDVIRLYTTQVYKTATPKFSTGERNMWWLKLLYDAGVLDVSELEYKFHSEEYVHHLNDSERSVLEGYRLLTMFKSSYKEYDGYTAFSDRFSSGWCNVSITSANRAKHSLIEQGFIAFVDSVNCDKNNEKFNRNVTRGLRPITTEDNFDELIQKSFENEEVYQSNRKKLKEEQKKEESEEKENKKVDIETKLKNVKIAGEKFATRLNKKNKVVHIEDYMIPSEQKPDKYYHQEQPLMVKGDRDP